MAQVKHPLHPNIIIDSVGTQETGGIQYKYSSDGGNTFLNFPTLVPTSISQNIVENDLKNPKTQTHKLFNHLLGTLPVGKDPSDPDDFYASTIVPALQRSPATVVGAPVDIANLVTQLVVDTPINAIDWAFKGFEGNMPTERYLSSEEPFLGSKNLARGFQTIGDLAREGIEATEKAGWNVEVPLIDAKIGLAKTPLDFLAFDVTPNESTKARKYISLITQIIGAAPAEGLAIAKLATELAKTTKNVTAQHVYDALSSLHRKNPLKAAFTEAGMGSLAGMGMVTSLEALPEDSPQWVKNTVAAGGGILFPIGFSTLTATAYDVGLKTPVIGAPLRILSGVTEGITPKGASRAANRALESMGGDWKNRSQILGVKQQLALALKEGRDMDTITRIAFTTPQLARNEARVLEAQLKASESSMTPDEINEQLSYIQGLRQFANFQEGQLTTLTSGGGLGAEAYAKYSDRLMDRRDAIMAALNRAVFKLDLGGKSSEDVDPSVLQADYDAGIATNRFEYEINRLKALREGRPASLSKDQQQAISNAYEETLDEIRKATDQALRDAEERVSSIRKSMPDEMTDQDRFNFNRWIRREIRTAYDEIDGYENVLWNNISGLDVPKTQSVVTPDGRDLGPEIVIDGVPIAQHFASKIMNLKAGEHENQSKYLYKLAGRDALIQQASEGAGQDAEKLARQNLKIKNQEQIVEQREREVEQLSAQLNQVGATAYVKPELQKARSQVAQLEAELKAIPQGQTIEDTTVIRRLNSVKQKLAGAQAKVLELSKEESINPELSKLQSKFETAQGRLIESKRVLEENKDSLEITKNLGQGVEHEGSLVNIADEIRDKGLLGVNVVDGIPVGREAQEIQNIISHLKAEMSFELGRTNSRSAKVAAIGDLISDLQRAIADPDNFSVDTVALDAARNMTFTKKENFSRGVVGEITGLSSKGQAKVPIERTIEKIAPPTGQETNLRQIQNALTSVAVGEGTAFKVLGQNEDGTINVELDPNFNLNKIAEELPAPFERIEEGRGTGLKVTEGTEPTQANIDLIRNTLWDRFKDFGAGDEFKASAASRWIEKNGAAIRWLEKATGKPTGFEDIASAESIVRSIQGVTKENLNKVVRTLQENNAFRDGFTEEGFRTLVSEAAKREANLRSAATFLDAPNPLVMGQRFVDQYLSNPDILDETLRVLAKDFDSKTVSNPALEGLRQAVAEELLRRVQTQPDAQGSPAAKEAFKYSESTGSQQNLFDPQKLIALSQDPRFSKLIGDLFGPQAPQMFEKIAEGARLQLFTGGAATPGVKVKDLVSTEWAGNIGRMAGGIVANYTPLSSLVATGIGRRYGVNALAAVKGNVVDRLLIDLLMNPKLAVRSMEDFSALSPDQQASLTGRVKLFAQEKFVNANVRRFENYIDRLRQAPGVLYELGEPTKYMELEEDTDFDEVSSAQPVAPPVRQVAANMPPPRPPVAASSLGQVNPLGGPPPMAQGPVSPQTMSGLSQLGLPLFANQGGYIDKTEDSGIMSVKCKPRQIVG